LGGSANNLGDASHPDRQWRRPLIRRTPLDHGLGDHLIVDDVETAFAIDARRSKKLQVTF